jgi:hypothetical protein
MKTCWNWVEIVVYCVRAIGEYFFFTNEIWRKKHKVDCFRKKYIFCGMSRSGKKISSLLTVIFCVSFLCRFPLWLSNNFISFQRIFFCVVYASIEHDNNEVSIVSKILYISHFFLCLNMINFNICWRNFEFLLSLFLYIFFKFVLRCRHFIIIFCFQFIANKCFFVYINSQTYYVNLYLSSHNLHTHLCQSFKKDFRFFLSNLKCISVFYAFYNKNFISLFKFFFFFFFFYIFFVESWGSMMSKTRR